MAVYQYLCQDCKYITEKMRLMKNRNNPQECEKCGGKTDRLIGNPGLVFKGTGFYVTDHKKPKEMKKQALKEKKARQEGKSGYKEI